MAFFWLFAFLVALLAVEVQFGFVKGQTFMKEWPHAAGISLVNYMDLKLLWPRTQVDLLEYTLQNSKRGDPVDVIQKIDDFCWKTPTMNVGDVKGKIVDAALESMGSSPKVVVEFGSYMGYSTLRLANLLRRTAPDAVLYSVDPNPLGHAVKTTMLDRAGLLGPKVSNELAFSGDVVKRLAEEGKKIDFLFLDHVKHLYAEDTQLAEKLGLFRPGQTIVVADNVISPGAPEYREWMLANKNYESTPHTTLLEYTKSTPDEVIVSKYLR